MQTSDPVANCLTKIRNASRVKHPTTDVPASKLTARLLAILKEEGFIKNYKTAGEAPKQTIKIYLKYGPDHVPAIAHLVRVSKSGRRRYAGVDSMPRVLSGIGRSILSTSKGVMTDQQARKQGVGGEILCYVW